MVERSGERPPVAFIGVWESREQFVEELIENSSWAAVPRAGIEAEVVDQICTFFDLADLPDGRVRVSAPSGSVENLAGEA